MAPDTPTTTKETVPAGGPPFSFVLALTIRWVPRSFAQSELLFLAFRAKGGLTVLSPSNSGSKISFHAKRAASLTRLRPATLHYL